MLAGLNRGETTATCQSEREQKLVGKIRSRESLGREGIDPDSPAASIYGLMARAAVEIEAEEGPKVTAVTNSSVRMDCASPIGAAYAMQKAAHNALLEIISPLLTLDEADIAGVCHQNKAVYDTILALQSRVIPMLPGEPISDASARHATQHNQRKEA